MSSDSTDQETTQQVTGLNVDWSKHPLPPGRSEERNTHTDACRGSLCPCYQEGVSDGRRDIEMLRDESNVTVTLTNEAAAAYLTAHPLVRFNSRPLEGDLDA